AILRSRPHELHCNEGGTRPALSIDSRQRTLTIVRTQSRIPSFPSWRRPPMRRSTIAVCLLLMSPVPVWACDGHPVGAPGWLEEKPRSAWDLARGTAEEVRWDEMLGVASLAAGSGAMVLGAGP